MTDYSQLKATELKDLLKERGIPSTGLTRKQQYIEALEAEDAGSGEAGADGEADGASGAVDDAGVADAFAKEEGDAAQVNGAHISPAEPASEPAAADAREAAPDQTEQMDAEMSSKPQQTEGQTSTREPSPESRKRKRRSPSPPVSQDSVNKRLKAVEEGNGAELKLPEDETMGDAAGDDQGGDTDTADQQRTEESVDLESSGSLHRPTRAIYIRELVRPVQPNQLRSHLEQVAAPADSNHEELEVFHLDALRTHAFAIFTSISAAVRARTSLHDHIWPDEPSRKPLWVDFVPDEEVNAWIETESTNGNRRDAKRWEVVYSGSDGRATATHQEATGRPELARAPSSNQNSKAPAASSNAREERLPSHQTSQRSPAPTSPTPARKPSAPEAPRSESFNQLDSRFKFTETKPKLYYLPRNRDLVDRRLDELESKTSRSWDGGRSRGGGPESQLRRYTFDDGDVLVDGGPDFGNFGAPPRRGGRGGGRGGPRGRR